MNEDQQQQQQQCDNFQLLTLQTNVTALILSVFFPLTPYHQSAVYTRIPSSSSMINHILYQVDTGWLYMVIVFLILSVYIILKRW